MSWEEVKLGDVVNFVGGAQPPKTDFSFEPSEDSIRLLQIRDYKSDANITYIPKDKARRFCDESDVMIGRYGPPIFQILRGLSGSYNVALMKAEPMELVDKDYLFYFLKQDNLFRLIDGLSQRSAGQSGIDMNALKAYPMLLPPLETQKQIAAVLEKADQLRKDCQQMEQELNSLAQSVFIDMFGDPVTNPKGWERTNLPAHGSFKNGLNFSKDDSGVSLKYLGVGDFKSLSSIRGLDNLGFVDVNSLPADDYLLKNGDLVFVRSNGNKALVGRCISIYPDDVPVTFSGFCIRYRVESDSMEPEWLNYMLRTASMKQAMLEGGQGANIQNINQKILSLLEIPLPPIDKQRLFCKTIESYRESLFQLNEYSQELNDLFNSLMQKAFKGELNL